MSASRAVPAKRHGFLSHGLVALAAIVAAYFFLFYRYPYLFPPSLPTSPGCSPVAMNFLDTNAKGERIRMAQTKCTGPWSDIGLYLQDADGRASRPLLILKANKPVIRAVWTSPDTVGIDITGSDVTINYARDRFGGVRMDYTLHEIPARD
jgi:hypothetical protein